MFIEKGPDRGPRVYENKAYKCYDWREYKRGYISVIITNVEYILPKSDSRKVSTLVLIYLTCRDFIECLLVRLIHQSAGGQASLQKLRF